MQNTSKEVASYIKVFVLSCPKEKDASESKEQDASESEEEDADESE